jgi:hypothetical protein
VGANWQILILDLKFSGVLVFFLYYCLFLCFKKILKKIKYFYFILLQINIFLTFSNHFDELISKIIF